MTDLVQGSYSKDMQFQILLVAEDIHLILRGLKKLPYEESAKIIGDFERVLLIPLMDAQKKAAEEAANKKTDVVARELPGEPPTLLADAKPKQSP